MSWSSPELAAPWVEQISDENQRTGQMQTLAQNWLRNDRQAAEAWIAKASFTEDQKKRLLKIPGP